MGVLVSQRFDGSDDAPTARKIEWAKFSGVCFGISTHARELKTGANVPASPIAAGGIPDSGGTIGASRASTSSAPVTTRSPS